MADLKGLADQVGRDWVEGRYYDDAEAAFAAQWKNLIWPIIRDGDFSVTLEIAAGHGRNTAKLLELAGEIIATDINDTNIAFLKERFAGDPRVKLIQNSGYDLEAVPDSSVTFVYCFDAMVHFFPEVVRAYIKEFRRVMKPGARGFVHYSNNHADPSKSYRDHPGWRNYMSREMFEGWLAEEGFRVVESYYVKWVSVIIPEDDGDCDAMTFFEAPGAAP
jgi:ubiquinone/menaquinone biosynthesis C-methylase UbiE